MYVDFGYLSIDQGCNHNIPFRTADVTRYAVWEKNPNNNQSTEEYIRRDFTTSEVHLDISGSYVSFVKPGTPLAQDGPGNNTCPVRPEFRAVGISKRD